MNRVFLSYQDGDPEAKRYAKLIAEGLEKHKLKALLEDEKPRSGNFDVALYDSLAASHAVVSVLFPRSLDSRWIEFEARTAKVQQKWYPVVFDNPTLPEALQNVHRTQGLGLDDPAQREQIIATLARTIHSAAGQALVYRGRSSAQEGAARSRLWGAIVTVASTFTTLISLLSNLGGLRDKVCSTDYARPFCASAGWLTDAPGPQDPNP